VDRCAFADRQSLAQERSGKLDERTSSRQSARENVSQTFPQASAAIVGGSSIGGLGSTNVLRSRPQRRGQSSSQRSRMDEAPGDPMEASLMARRRHEKGVVKNISKSLPQYIRLGRTPLQELDGIITPNGLFYERHHGGVPSIDPAQHRLMLHAWSIVRLYSRWTISGGFHRNRGSISSNARQSGLHKTYGKRRPIWSPFELREWTGVRLNHVLEEPACERMRMDRGRGRRCRCADEEHPDREMPRGCHARLQPERRTAASHQGYPLRLLLPGFEANMNVKWLRRLKSQPNRRIRAKRLPNIATDARWHLREFTFYMEAKSIITRPSGGQLLRGPVSTRSQALPGAVAQDQARRDIVDGGKNWQNAQLQEPVLTRAADPVRIHGDGTERKS